MKLLLLPVDVLPREEQLLVLELVLYDLLDEWQLAVF